MKASVNNVGTKVRLEDLLEVSSIDKNAASLVIGVEQFKAGLFVHRPHHITPLLADAHRTELKGRDAHTSVGRYNSVAAELGRWWCRCPDRHDSKELWVA